MKSIRQLGLTIERSCRQRRWVLRLRHCREQRNAWLRNASALPSDRSLPNRCLLDLSNIAIDGEQGRRFHHLVSLLTHGGYSLSMVPRLSFLQTAHRTFKSTALAQIRPYLGSDSRTRPFDLCLFDKTHPATEAKQSLYVTASCSRSLKAQELPLPYGPFPSVWDEDWESNLTHFRNTERNWRLFFGGHCSESSYAKIRKFQQFPVLNRFATIATTKSFFGNDTLLIQNDTSFARAMRISHDGFVLLDNGLYRTHPKHWLEMIARSDFFLAAPGGDYPLSHNVVEAMAVGTVPVIEYGPLMAPPLTDQKNCLTYQGAEGLRRTLAKIRLMDRQQIAALRTGAAKYYDQHLSASAFTRALKSGSYRGIHMLHYLAPKADLESAAA
ncbi:MAG: hypothetical protein AAGJ83_00155 [Planctomycetota bacterium]